jgi:hypothetical protein
MNLDPQQQQQRTAAAKALQQVAARYLQQKQAIAAPGSRSDGGSLTPAADTNSYLRT